MMPTPLHSRLRCRLGAWCLLATISQSGAQDFRVLVFSKTAGFRHNSIPAGLAAIQQLGAATVTSGIPPAEVLVDYLLGHNTDAYRRSVPVLPGETRKFQRLEIWP